MDFREKEKRMFDAMFNENETEKQDENRNEMVNSFGVVTQAQIDEFVKFATELERIEKLQKEFKDNVRKEMENRGITKIDLGLLKISLSPDTEKTTFDSKTFEIENPELYEKYLKTNAVKGSLRITIRDNKGEGNGSNDND